MDTSKLKINEEAHKYNDNFLDVTNVFNTHEKGLPEWIKNSLGAYIREDIEDRYIIIRFTDGERRRPATIECIDFVGMVKDDFESFKEWGNPNASSRGLNKFTFGGHGNGGKYYMRQLFGSSHFITFKNSKINIFGFSENNKKYGFAEGFEDKKSTLEEALNLANIDKSIIPSDVYEEMRQGKRGFTVVIGFKPHKLQYSKLPVEKICEKLRNHPQARRPLKYSHVVIVHNGRTLFKPLAVNEIVPLEGFEEIYTFEAPERYFSKSLNKEINFSENGYSHGVLALRTARDPLRGNEEELNSVDIETLKLGPIASYRMAVIGSLQYYSQAQQIYGECNFPILDKYEKELVQNDRVFLNDSELTTALLEWIRSCIDELGKKIFDSIAEAKRNEALEITDEFNNLLNNWKNQFLKKLLAEILGGTNPGSSTGGPGEGGSGGGTNNVSNTKGGLGSGGSGGGGEGEQKKPGLRAPIVLISERSTDPDFPDQEPPIFPERFNIIEQRQEDVSRGIYWINIRKPMAKKILLEYGADSPKWRNYLFQRYVDIITTNALETKSQEEGGQLTKDQIYLAYMDIASRIYDKAFEDLENYIMDDKFHMQNEQ